MSSERFASVWDAIEDTPEAAENMKLRSALMISLKRRGCLGCPNRASRTSFVARSICSGWMLW